MESLPVAFEHEVALTRKESETYLITKHGRVAAVSAKTLAKLASVGGGPAFRRIGRRVAYMPSDLDAWVAHRSSNLMKSTSG